MTVQAGGRSHADGSAGHASYVACLRKPEHCERVKYGKVEQENRANSSIG
jgi:hypothetical protein